MESRHTFSHDPDRAAVELAREHEALANMQGADSRRIDGLVADVGEIKGDMRSLRGDMQRIGSGVEQLQESMAVLNRHAVLMETQASDIATLRRDTAGLDQRLRSVEMAIPPLQEARKVLWGGMLATIGAVGAALVALVVKKP